MYVYVYVYIYIYIYIYNLDTHIEIEIYVGGPAGKSIRYDMFGERDAVTGHHHAGRLVHGTALREPRGIKPSLIYRNIHKYIDRYM